MKTISFDRFVRRARALAAPAGASLVVLLVLHGFLWSRFKSATRDQDWARLAGQLEAAAAGLPPAAPSEPGMGTERYFSLQSLLPNLSARAGDGLLAIDSAGRICAAGDDGLLGKSLAWTTEIPSVAESADARAVRFERGFAEIEGVSVPAVSLPLPTGGGHLLAVSSSASAFVAAGEFLPVLVAAELALFAVFVGVFWSWSRRRGSLEVPIVAELADDAVNSEPASWRMRDSVIFGLTRLTESNDPAVSRRLERLWLFATEFALALRGDPRYADEVGPEFTRAFGLGAILFDVAHVDASEAFILKRGALSVEERDRVHRHVSEGGACLREIERFLGETQFIRVAREVTLGFHERWDGTGSPRGLAGESIPLSARAMAIVSAYEAMTGDPIESQRFSPEACRAELRERAIEDFDPELVEIFLDRIPRFEAIAAECDRFRRRSARPAARETSTEMIPSVSVVASSAEPAYFREF